MLILQGSRSSVCCMSTMDCRPGNGKEGNKKNKKNRKKGKVRIIAGIMTREQDSDSTQPPEEERRYRYH